jgi:hypothetical protein
LSGLFLHPTFAAAINDIEALGFRVSDQPSPDSVPYGIVGGRSNSRWWLIPLANRHVATSGMALFQPLLASAKLVKRAAKTASALGLSSLWAKKKLYMTGTSYLTEVVGSQNLYYAFFTGTDSPHRKVAVQIMDGHGNLKGFAKLTRNPQVRTLLAHEAATLERVHTLGLQTAYVPRVLFSGEHRDCTLLVTDTLKTPRTPSTTRFTQAHRAFVQELDQKTAEPHQVCASDIGGEFRARFSRIRPQLEQTWSQRLDAAIGALETQTDLQLPACLSHGDFTPWNTFMSNGRLYVFDWEYAEQARPPSNDIIHFVLNQPQVRNQPASAKIEAVRACLSQFSPRIQKEAAPALLMIYLLTQTLRQIERLPGTAKHTTWDGADEIAAILDGVLAGNIHG